MTHANRIARNIYFGTALLLCCLFLIADMARSADLPKYNLVYSRQPRMAEKYENWHRWYDAGAPDRFTEADLVTDDMDGHVKVIYDCTSSAAVCSAHDNRVSPDGTKILFTLATGTALYPVQMWAVKETTPPIEFKAASYSLYVYDTATGTATLLERNARQGDWLSNDAIVFASNRAGTYAPRTTAGVVPNYDVPALQIYRANIVAGKLADTVNLTPASPFAMNPTVMHDGRICYSEWDGYGSRADAHTPANFWWPRCMNGDGTDDMVVLNAHGSTYLKTRDYLKGIVDPARSGEGSTALKVVRPVREIRPNTLIGTSYYRSNHKQTGILFLAKLVRGVEGYSQASNLVEAVYPSTLQGTGRFMPELTVLTPYANDQDLSDVGTRFDLQGRAMGKAGWGAPTLKGRGLYLFTHGRGSCYEGTVPMYTTTAAMGGEPTCQTQIREAYVPHVTDPFNWDQAATLACADLKFNCFDANWLAPYSALQFNQSAPDYKPYVAPTSISTTLHIVDARATQLYKLAGPNYRPTDDCAYQGCGDPDYSKKVTAIKIEKVEHWKTLPTANGFASQSTVGVYPITNADGSMSITLPCGINYLTSGVDADGNVVARDQTVHAAVCGEIVTCHGCHDGHGQERAAQLKLPAVERFKTTTAGQQPAPGC